LALLFVHELTSTQPVSVVWQVTFPVPETKPALQELAFTKPVSDAGLTQVVVV
jgi:hypothetical protein